MGTQGPVVPTIRQLQTSVDGKVLGRAMAEVGVPSKYLPLIRTTRSYGKYTLGRILLARYVSRGPDPRIYKTTLKPVAI